jgi:hypothetical protein
MSRDTFDPKLFIPSYATPVTSPFAETSFSTDVPSMPERTAMGFAETAFSTDTATTARELCFAVVQDDWVI